MNRRKAIYAMLCGIVGPTATSQLNTQGLTVSSFSLPLDGISFVFTHKGETVKLTGEEIWKELNLCQEGQVCLYGGQAMTDAEEILHLKRENARLQKHNEYPADAAHLISTTTPAPAPMSRTKRFARCLRPCQAHLNRQRSF